MSSDAAGWVYRHSPYKGATLAVHHAVADSVNDQHNQEFWLRVWKLAKKARVNRTTAQEALERLEADGYLDLIERGGGRSRPSRYRFVFVEDAPVVYDSRETVASADSKKTVGSRAETVGSRAETVVTDDRHRTQENPSTTQALKTLALESFERFWKAYPKQRGKGAAREVWLKRIGAGAEAEHLIVMADRYAKYVVAALEVGEIESMHFVPWPQKWLREEREDDHLTMPGRSPAARSKVDQAIAEMQTREARRNGGASQGAGDHRNGDGRMELGDGRGHAAGLDDRAR